MLGEILKQMINLGAYGWRHKHWLKSFYPEDLPADGEDDWRLSYYSNEFNTVLIPADYWRTAQINNCEDWLDSVPSDFRFFVECHGSIFDSISPADLTEALKVLSPQLSALVFLDEDQPISEAVKKSFIQLSDSLELEVLGAALDSTTSAAAQKIWRSDNRLSSASDASQSSGFAFLEDGLSDLRSARVTVERFVAQLNENEEEATIIVNHPQLFPADLSKLRAVLDIMGY